MWVLACVLPLSGRFHLFSHGVPPLRGGEGVSKHGALCGLFKLFQRSGVLCIPKAPRQKRSVYNSRGPAQAERVPLGLVWAPPPAQEAF